MEDFCDKMQLLNAIGYQGIFEAAGHKLNDIGGVMLWKLNAAFPSVVWQVYDWFLQPNAGYYFMQNACEPVHIQLNLSNNKVTILNRTYKSIANLTAKVEVFSLDSKSLFKEEAYFSLAPTEVKETTSLSSLMEKTSGINFIVLNLRNPAGNVVSHNVYWLSSGGDYKALNTLPETPVSSAILRSEKLKNENRWTIKVTNNSDKIAFFIRPQLLVNGEEVLPSNWSGNYFSLAQSESKTVSVSCPTAMTAGANPVIKVSGWNVPEQVMTLQKKQN
jgi:hypothetical protein